jgi:hypothetical protein
MYTGKARTENAGRENIRPFAISSFSKDFPNKEAKRDENDSSNNNERAENAITKRMIVAKLKAADIKPKIEK